MNILCSRVKREIAVASDQAARAYKDNTPIEDQSGSGVWDAMTTAANNFVNAVKKKDFTKYLAIANPKNGDDFLAEVRASPLILELFASYFILFLFSKF